MKKWVYFLLPIIVLLAGCKPAGKHSQYDSSKFGEELPCASLASIPDDVSLFITFHAVPFGVTLKASKTGDWVAELESSLNIGVIEAGIEEEHPIKKDDADFLYLKTINRKIPEDKQAQIRCLDMRRENVQITFPDSGLVPKIIVAFDEMKMFGGSDPSAYFVYQTAPDSHLLTIDITDGDIDIEISPLPSIQERRIVKPEPPMMYCVETWQKNPLAALIVCPSDLLESVLGFLPWLLGHIHSTLGIISSYVVYLAVIVGIGKKAFQDETAPLFTFLLVLFLVWISLIWFKALPFFLL